MKISPNKSESQIIIIESTDDFLQSRLFCLARSSDNSFDLYLRSGKTWDWVDSIALESAGEKIRGADSVFVLVDDEIALSLIKEEASHD